MQLNETSNIGTVKVKCRLSEACDSEIANVLLMCALLICVNIIKSTSTMRCRRQSVFDVNSEKKTAISFLEKPAVSHPFFRRAEKNAFAQAGESSLLQDRQAREIFCSRKSSESREDFFRRVFFFGPQDTSCSCGKNVGSSSSSSALSI